VCREPSCDDGVLIGDETGGDCGGSCAGCALACSAEALELIDLLNEYRAENGKPPIAAAPSLCFVSDTHVMDLDANTPPAGCNLHSWSAAGPWSDCCYTPDHAQAQCMWDKPRELTDYPGNGYEVSAAGIAWTPALVLEAWKGSPGHNAVLLSEGIWAGTPWLGVGAGFYGTYAVMWFGHQTDPVSQ
jgi:hypothetical protein